MDHTLRAITRDPKTGRLNNFPVPLDPGVKSVLKNGAVSVFVDQAVWTPTERYDAKAKALAGANEDARTFDKMHRNACHKLEEQKLATGKAVKERQDLQLEVDGLRLSLERRKGQLLASYLILACLFGASGYLLGHFGGR